MKAKRYRVRGVGGERLMLIKGQVLPYFSSKALTLNQHLPQERERDFYVFYVNKIKRE